METIAVNLLNVSRKGLLAWEFNGENTIKLSIECPEKPTSTSWQLQVEYDDITGLGRFGFTRTSEDVSGGKSESRIFFPPNKQMGELFLHVALSSADFRGFLRWMFHLEGNNTIKALAKELDYQEDDITEEPQNILAVEGTDNRGDRVPRD
jgi:hypothetical protein